MTKEQKVEAYAMLLDGCKYQEVANKFGVSRQYIQQIYPQMEKRFVHEDFIYPNIAKWFGENKMTVREFAGIVNTNPSTVFSWFRGVHEPRKFFIDCILTVTGMTYEEAFREEVCG